MKRPRLWFAIQCHNFQLRLRWQLRSIAEQSPHRMPITIDLAYMPDKQPHTPTVQDVIAEYPELDIYRHEIHRRGSFARRAYVRTRQIQAAHDNGASHIFFGDCDVVYHPDFFAALSDRILDGARIEKCLYSFAKCHTRRDPTDRLVARPGRIENAYATASKLHKRIKRNRRTAAGGMQVCDMDEVMRKTGGNYVAPGKSRDNHLFRRGQHAYSDVQFRIRMGGSERYDLPRQIHLDHERDKEAGYHLEVLR